MTAATFLISALLKDGFRFLQMRFIADKNSFYCTDFSNGKLPLK
jgi:hypothetical protein